MTVWQHEKTGEIVGQDTIDRMGEAGYVRLVPARDAIDHAAIAKLSAMLDDRMQRTENYRDVELVVHHCLTEPTCPTATIDEEEFDGVPEGQHFARADRNTIEDAINAAVAQAIATMEAAR